jgi:hypothetical protein
MRRGEARHHHGRWLPPRVALGREQPRSAAHLDTDLAQPRAAPETVGPVAQQCVDEVVARQRRAAASAPAARRNSGPVTAGSSAPCPDGCVPYVPAACFRPAASRAGPGSSSMLRKRRGAAADARPAAGGDGSACTSMTRILIRSAGAAPLLLNSTTCFPGGVSTTGIPAPRKGRRGHGGSVRRVLAEHAKRTAVVGGNDRVQGLRCCGGASNQAGVSPRRSVETQPQVGRAAGTSGGRLLSDFSKSLRAAVSFCGWYANAMLEAVAAGSPRIGRNTTFFRREPGAH